MGDSSIYFSFSQALSTLFILFIGLLFIFAVILFLIDRYQTSHTIRRNYPLIGRFRYMFERLGEFFRQYFYSMDREELPFNRAQRSWIYRAAKNLDNTQAFGTTRQEGKYGDIIFVNTNYPVLEEEARPVNPILFGPYCRNPYQTDSIFNISGMSFGAISKPAVRALSKGARLAGCWLNTGEGGLSQWHLEGGCDIVLQIGTAKYGVRNVNGELSDEKLHSLAALEQLKMFEIKLSQGAKPGKGGILPAVKVTSEIAEIRGIEVGKSSISPNRHRDIGNDSELLNMIAHIREVTGKPVGIKTVIGDMTWLDRFFTLINQRGIESAPDFIALDSGDGGTGAAPQTLLDDVGLHIRETLPALVDKLKEYGLIERIVTIASGKMVNPAEVAWAFCVGADCVATARGFMFSLGCIQAMQCNKNTCPTGITTHNPRLQRGLVTKDKTSRVAHYHANMLKELTTIALSCGVHSPQELQRKHARMVITTTQSISLERVYGNNEIV